MSFNSTRPLTVAATSATGANTAARLKKVPDRQVMVVVFSRACADISRLHLGTFERQDDVRRQLVHHVSAKNPILADTAESQVGVAVVVYAVHNVEGQP